MAALRRRGDSIESLAERLHRRVHPDHQFRKRCSTGIPRAALDVGDIGRMHAGSRRQLLLHDSRERPQLFEREAYRSLHIRRFHDGLTVAEPGSGSHRR
jgi:hypothetical protein